MSIRCHLGGLWSASGPRRNAWVVADWGTGGGLFESARHLRGAHGHGRPVQVGQNVLRKTHPIAKIIDLVRRWSRWHNSFSAPGFQGQTAASLQ